MKSFIAGLGVAACLLGGPAFAQSLSVEEIKARAAEKLRNLNAYHEALADPDPAQSLAVMEVMLEEGDPALQKIALDYGLYSPNPAVRRKALEGFFASEPRLEVFVEGGDVRDLGSPPNDRRTRFVNAIGGYGGSVAAGNKGYFTWKLGKFDAGQDCVLSGDGKECVVRITDSGVSLKPWGSWLLFTLDQEGNLIGGNPVPGAGTFPMRIPIRQ